MRQLFQAAKGNVERTFYRGARREGWRLWEGILRCKNNDAGTAEVALYDDKTGVEVDRVSLGASEGKSGALIEVPGVYTARIENISGSVSVDVFMDGDVSGTTRAVPDPLSDYDFTTGDHYGFENASPQPGAMRSRGGLRYSEHDFAETDETTVTTVADSATSSVPGGASVALPYTGQVEARAFSGQGQFSFGGASATISGAAWRTYRITGTPSAGEEMKVSADPGATIEYRAARYCEGQELFVLEKAGQAKWMARVSEGNGLLHEPETTNKCLNNTLAPTDTTNVTDGAGVTTTRVARESLPADVRAALDANPKFVNVTAMYRSQGSGTTYATGPTGNTSEHFVRGLLWAETGTAGAVLGLENNSFAPISATETLEWVGGKGTPLAATDRWSISVVSGDVYWIANMLHQGVTARSHIPANGSQRTVAADAPQKPADEAGLDLRRNSIPNSSTDSAVLGEIGNGGSVPDGWDSTPTSGFQIEVTDKGPDGNGSYIANKYTGDVDANGQQFLRPMSTDDVPALQGETWISVCTLSIDDGDLTNIFKIKLETHERTSTGAYIGHSEIDVTNLLSGTPTEFSIARTLTSASAGRVLTIIAISADSNGGPVNFTLRISRWSLQKTTASYGHVETTGESIVPFVSAYKGFTIIDESTDLDIQADNQTLASLSGSSSATDRIDLRNGSGAGQANGELYMRKDSTDTTISGGALGEKAQGALKESDEELWLDQISAGTAAAALTEDITTLSLGSMPRLQKRFTIYGSRLTGAV